MKHPPRWDHIVSSEAVIGGAPRIEGTRIGVECLVGRFAAGDSIHALCADYDLREQQVTEAIRAVCAACYGQRGMFARVYEELVRSTPAQLTP